jgi:ABC-type multidrug transport system fused ATPase/permease subunit
MTVTQEPPAAADAPQGDGTTDEQHPGGRENFVHRFLERYRNGFSLARQSLFWACLSRQKRTLKWMFAMLILSSVALLQIANLTRGMVDNAIVAQTAPLFPYVTHIAFWAVWGLIFGFATQQLGDRLSYSIEFDLRVWLYTHVQSAELRALDQVATGQLITRSITDLQLVEYFLRVFPTLIGFSPLLIAVAVLVIILNPFIGVMAILALPLNIIILRRFTKRLRALSWAELNERAEVTRSIDEPVRGIRVVKAFGREQEETAKVEHVTARAYRYSMSRADHHAGRAARGGRLAPQRGRAQPRHVSPRVPARHRPRHDREHLRRARQRLAVPAGRAGPPRRDAGAQLPPHHRRPHGAGTLDRPGGRRRHRHVREP